VGVVSLSTCLLLLIFIAVAVRCDAACLLAYNGIIKALSAN
jgi:hypothetical protein